MQDEYTEKTALYTEKDEEALYEAIERDARRYNKAFGEEEEARYA